MINSICFLEVSLLPEIGIQAHIYRRRQEVGSTHRQADAPLRAEMQRSALDFSYDEQPMPDINPEVLDLRVPSGLFAGMVGR